MSRIMNLLAKFRLIFAAALVAGCATPNIEPSFALSEDKTTGVVTGSITYANLSGAHIITLVELASGKQFRVQHGTQQTLNLATAFFGEEPHPGLGVRGSPFAIELPAGRYSVLDWRVHVGAANIRSTATTGVEFKVEAAKAVYIGNYHFRDTSRFGRMPTSMVVTLSNKSERDFRAIQESFPSLAGTPITQMISMDTSIEGLGGSSTTKITLPTFVPVMR
jgi:hypothetical protein